MNPHGVVVTLQHRPHAESAQDGAAEKDCQGKPALRRLQPRRTQTPAQVQQAVQGHQKSQVPILGLLIKNAPKPFHIKLVKCHGHRPAEHIQIGDVRSDTNRAEQPRQADALPFRFPKAPRSCQGRRTEIAGNKKHDRHDEHVGPDDEYRRRQGPLIVQHVPPLRRVSHIGHGAVKHDDQGDDQGFQVVQEYDATSAHTMHLTVMLPKV